METPPSPHTGTTAIAAAIKEKENERDSTSSSTTTASAAEERLQHRRVTNDNDRAGSTFYHSFLGFTHSSSIHLRR